MYTRSDNVEIMFGDDNDDIIEQLFRSLLQKHEENLQNKMKGSDFEFDGVNFLYYDFNKISLNRKNTRKNNLTCDKQVILLMITDGEKWHYLTVKILSGLLRGITSTHKEDFYCLNCFHSYGTKNKLEAHKKICENHNYCNVEILLKTIT